MPILSNSYSLHVSAKMSTTAFLFKTVTWCATSLCVPIHQLPAFIHCKENANLLHQSLVLIDRKANNLGVAAAIQLLARHANPKIGWDIISFSISKNTRPICPWGKPEIKHYGLSLCKMSCMTRYIQFEYRSIQEMMACTSCASGRFPWI
jgi:hypothetical protein